MVRAEGPTQKVKTCKECGVEYPVKQYQPRAVLCPKCKEPLEAARMKRRRMEEKVKREQQLHEAKARAALEHHLTSASPGSLVAKHQEGMRTLVDILCGLPRDDTLFDTIGANYRELAVPPTSEEECGRELKLGLWRSIVARSRPNFNRLDVNLPLEEIVEEGRAAAAASAKEYYGSVPFLVHHTGIIYAKKGTSGVWPVAACGLRQCGRRRSRWLRGVSSGDYGGGGFVGAVTATARAAAAADLHLALLALVRCERRRLLRRRSLS